MTVSTGSLFHNYQGYKQSCQRKFHQGNPQSQVHGISHLGHIVRCTGVIRHIWAARLIRCDRAIRIARLVRCIAILGVDKGCHSGFTVADYTGSSICRYRITIVIAFGDRVVDIRRQLGGCAAFTMLERHHSGTIIKCHITVCSTDSTVQLNRKSEFLFGIAGFSGYGFGNGQVAVWVFTTAANRHPLCGINGIVRYRCGYGRLPAGKGITAASRRSAGKCRGGCSTAQVAGYLIRKAGCRRYRLCR